MLYTRQMTPKQFSIIFTVLYATVAIIVDKPGDDVLIWSLLAVGTVAALLFSYNLAVLILKFKEMIPPIPPIFTKQPK